MADDRSNEERKRVEYLRQRWAQENFRASLDDNGQAEGSRSGRHNVQHDMELTEVDQPPPAQPQNTLQKNAKRSWRDSLLRRTPERFTPAAPATRSVQYAETGPSYVSSFTDEEGGYEDIPVRTPTLGGEDKQPPAWLMEVYTLSWLTFFSLLGTLARIGVEALTQYPNAPVTSRVLWANIGGSFVMGFFVEDRRIFRQSTTNESHKHSSESEVAATHLKFKKTIPLYLGITTGFCGSFTSFSSFVRDGFLALTNDLASPNTQEPYRPIVRLAPRNGGFSFLALCAIVIIHPALSLAALKVGAHFALLTAPFLRPIPSKLLTKLVDPLMVLLGLGSWIFGALFLTIFPPGTGPSAVDWRARATIPLLFAPLGCILRYYLAKWCNTPARKNFPLGTFIANIFATVVLGMAWDLQHAKGNVHLGVLNGNACAVLLGVQEGFCGCLSTVSTWVVELNGLSRKNAWIYGSVSTAVGISSLIVIMGSMGWTVGFGQPVCG